MQPQIQMVKIWLPVCEVVSCFKNDLYTSQKRRNVITKTMLLFQLKNSFDRLSGFF